MRTTTRVRSVVARSKYRCPRSGALEDCWDGALEKCWDGSWWWCREGVPMIIIIPTVVSTLCVPVPPTAPYMSRRNDLTTAQYTQSVFQSVKEFANLRPI